MTKENNTFTEGKILRSLLLFAFPVLFSLNEFCCHCITFMSRFKVTDLEIHKAIDLHPVYKTDIRKH